ncbi:hypothetical protein Gohar_025094 [Gossypium harknessii]|uniref:Uncharacterized protein n=1 Tax=Gossypium harknessii TaxID=34285 RepID=A0A7J9HI67_9ROSI|nr:hypothetical protein [Gossypium harknessii]
MPYSLLSSSLMIPPIFTSTPTASALHPPLNMQRPYGTPMLQPFPSPTPSTSFTHVGLPTLHYGLFISRDKVRDALLMLAQGNDQRNHINPIFGFNFEGSQISPDLNPIGSSIGMGRINMKHDLEENSIVNIERKKRPKINVLFPNVSELSDSSGIIVEQNNVHIQQGSAAANGQVDRVQ